MNDFAQLAGGDDAKFLLRWRGRQEGPYPAAVIEAKLTANEIGLLHEIFQDEKWVTIRDYVAERVSILHAANQAREEQERRDRQEAERQAQARKENAEEQRLAELKRNNDLLERQSRVSNQADQSGTPGISRTWGQPAPKSRGVYIILGLLLGLLGIHNFYAGYNSKGALQLIISVIGALLIFPIVIVAIWVLIELISVTEDANGVKFE